MGSLPAEAPAYLWPTDMFTLHGDLTFMQENIDKVVQGLTKWEPETKSKGIVGAPRMISIAGADYEQTVTNMNEEFLKRLWGDGHTLLPPTVKKVDWMLRGTDLPRDKVVAKIEPEGGLATVESIAINAVMAGCRPEYMPVLIGAVEAIAEPEFDLAHYQTSTGPGAVEIIVNGPIRKQLDINCRAGMYGPGWKANAAIGRALRLITMNVGKAFPGVVNMKQQSQPGAYGICIGEDEESYPADYPGWQPLSVDQGFTKCTNIVTARMNYGQVPCGDGGLLSMALAMTFATNMNPMEQGRGTVLFIVSPEDLCAYIIPGFKSNHPNFPRDIAPCPTKQMAKEYIWEHSKIPVDHWIDCMPKKVTEGYYNPGGQRYDYVMKNLGKKIPQVADPDHIAIIVGGGKGGHSEYVLTGGESAMQTKEIRLPRAWDTLLEEAKTHVRRPFRD